MLFLLPIDLQPLIPNIDSLNMSRCSGRVIKAHVKLTLIGESSFTIPDSHEDDPIANYEAINDKDSKFWKDAMKSEL